jgi:uncharacterized protein with FMN-binding domain
MRRALVAVALTVAGLVPLLRYHPHAGASVAQPMSPPAGSTGSAGSAASGSESGSSGSSDTGPSGSSGTGPSGQDAVDGQVADTDFGPYQVRAVFQGSRLVDVQMVLTPSDRHSERIAEEADPTLREEALQAQSAKIDTVSGATATSEGYAQSLQSAIDAHAQGK